MTMTPAFKRLFADIGMDLVWPLLHPETRSDGGRSFRDVVYAEVWGYRPLMLNIIVPKGEAKIIHSELYQAKR